MAKKNNNIIPALFSINRRIDTTVGSLYSMEGTDDSTAEKIKVLTRTGNCTTNNRTVKEDDVTNSNLQTFDYCKLKDKHNVLKSSYNITFHAVNINDSCAFSTVEFNDNYLSKFMHDYADKFHFKELAHRYLTNMINGRTLWRNVTDMSDIIQVRITKLSFNTDKQKSWTFGSSYYENNDKISKDKFSFVDKNMEEIENLIADTFSDMQKTVRFKVETYVYLSEGSFVYPSQSFVQNSTDKTLYKIDDYACFTAEKIGNAIRTIDDFYPAYEEKKVIIPIEPFGQCKKYKMAFRYDKKSDYFTLTDRLFKNGEKLSDNELHFIMANFIRGGLFGESSKDSE